MFLAHVMQEGELLSFSTQAQTRRESLTGRPDLKGAALITNAQPAHQTQPALRSIVEEAELPNHSHSRLTAAAAAAAAALAAPREAAVASTQPSATTQPQQQTLAPPPASLTFDRFDPHSSQDDDACTAALGATIGSSSREHIVSLPAGAPSSSKAVKLASEIFEDQGLKKLVSEVLHKQLQRTKDGATDKSRIHELAGVTSLPTCEPGLGRSPNAPGCSRPGIPVRLRHPVHLDAAGLLDAKPCRACKAAAQMRKGDGQPRHQLHRPVRQAGAGLGAAGAVQVLHCLTSRPRTRRCHVRGPAHVCKLYP